MSNAMLVIQPYRMGHGPWVFDDERVGLRAEPFVGEINTMIDLMLRDARVKNPSEGFTAYFSADVFPGYHMRLDYVMGDAQHGTTYSCPQYHDDKGAVLEGWLCPALGKYFGLAPKSIYVRAESIPQLTLCDRIRRWFARNQTATS